VRKSNVKAVRFTHAYSVRAGDVDSSKPDSWKFDPQEQRTHRDCTGMTTEYEICILITIGRLCTVSCPRVDGLRAQS